MTSSLAPGAVRRQVKRRQRHRRARNRASKNEFRAPTECSQREGHTGGNDIASFRKARRSPRAVRTSRNCTRENRETSPVSGAYPGSRIGPGSPKRNPGMHAGEESNIGIVPTKPPNKAGGDICGGGGGGKAGDQGEYHGALHVPDTDQGKRVPGAVWCTWAGSSNAARRHDAERGHIQGKNRMQ